MNVRVACACIGVALSGAAAVMVGCGDSSAPALVSVYDSGTDGSTSGGDGGSASDGGTSDSGSIALGGDGGSPDDAGPGGNTSVVTCGATSCSIPAEQCCVYPNQNPPPDFSYACSTGGVCPSAGGGDQPSSLKCGSAANCPSGTVCCVGAGGGDSSSSSCQASCTGGQAQLCDPSVSPAASGCGDAGACSNANIGDFGLPGSFGTCGGKGN